MKKKTLIILGILIVVLGVIGISYALWTKVLVQSGENIVNADCFELTFLEEQGIELENSFPMLDRDGSKLKPYHFSLQNKCNNEVDYQLNLETTNETTLKDHYLKIKLNEKNPYLYSSLEETSVSIQNGRNARILESGRLKGLETKEYDLRLWMDHNVTQNDEGAMNGVFESKITIQATYLKPTIASIIKNIPVVTSGDGLYEVHHEDAEITYTEDVELQNRLKQTELRYAGPNPDNYVWFNEELWRIIGLVNTPEGQRVKIIRDESIGKYAWDSSDSSINNGYGVNEWSTSKIMNLLNHGAYYNRTSGTCYNGQNNATKVCDFSNSGLLEKSKEMIDTITWNTGSNGTTLYDNINIIKIYSLERSNNIGKVCNGGSMCTDNIERKTTWVGKLGLMYPSDYGYATSGGRITNRETCLNIKLSDWDTIECKDNNWLYDSNNSQLTLFSDTSNVNACDVWFLTPDYVRNYYNASNSTSSSPTLYLKTNINFIGGLGTRENPYLLSI